jgi:hypothetical protein
MPLKPLATVTNYQEMLRRIAFFTFVASLFAVKLLRSNSAAIDSLLAQIDIDIELPYVGRYKTLGYVLPAAVVALIFYTVRLHDLLSSCFGIRYLFDTRKIIKPFGIAAGLDENRIKQLYPQRHDLMKDLFYKYASSKNPQIDTHNIHETLDNWTWIWVSLEAWFVFFCTGVTLLFLTSPWVGVLTIVGASIVGGVLCPFYFARCCKYAKFQVDEILSDPEREKIIKRRLNALQM